MTEELLKEEPKKTIKLGDKEYWISPLNMNVMMAIEEEFDCNFTDFGRVLSDEKTKQITAMGKLLHILLKENYPELSLADMGKMLNLDNMEEATDLIGRTLFREEYDKVKQEVVAKPKVRKPGG